MNRLFLALMPFIAVNAVAAEYPERISFSSFRPSGWDIYLIDADSEPEALTSHPALDYGAAWSPDGRYVVFTSERDGSPDLFVLDMKTRYTPQKLIESPAMEDQAVFMPDARQIIFVSTRDGNSDLYRIDFTPSQTVTLDRAEKLTDDPRADIRPTVSPDGRYAVFTSNRGATDQAHPRFPFALLTFGDLYRLDLRDKHLQRLTENKGWDGSAAYSRDGESIYFYSDRHGSPQIHRMNADGTDVTLVGLERDAIAVTEMADGSIVYETTRDEDSQPRWEIRRRLTDRTEAPVATASLYCHGPKGAPHDMRLLCHGGKKDIFSGESGTSFFGPTLAPNYPLEVRLVDRVLALYPVRNPFSAPLSPVADEYFVLGMSPYEANLVDVGDGSVTSLISLIPDDLRPDRRQIMGVSWDPDGSSLVFSIKRFRNTATQGDIWRVSRNDGTLINLTEAAIPAAGMPDIGTGGAQIVFAGRDGDATDLFLMNADGTNVRNITQSPERENFPALSPNGRLIAYASDLGGWLDETSGERSMDIYLAALSRDAQLHSVVRVTNTPGQEGHVRFSPGGEWLIYTSGAGDINDEYPVTSSIIFSPQLYGEIWLYRITDGEKIRLTHNKWEDGAPYWVPAVGE